MARWQELPQGDPPAKELAVPMLNPQGRDHFMVTELTTSGDLRLGQELVEDSGLRFEEGYDNLVGLYEGPELIACGARAGNILKMLALRPQAQGGAVLGELITELVRLGCRAGHDSFFVFTPPQNAPSFQALNFRLLVSHPKAALLEYGQGLQHYLAQKSILVRRGDNGALIANCNPFTLGHRYLIERAAAQVDSLYVFVVREDRSAFPFEARLSLVEAGVGDLGNVIVLDSSHYAISAVTFPAYFLKAGDSPTQIQMEIDLLLFARHLAPFFGVRRRFIGTEPRCGTTHRYSEAMKRTLAPLGIETVQIERKTAGDEPISAYRVREAMARGELAALESLLPATTLEYIHSKEGRQIRRRLAEDQRRH